MNIRIGGPEEKEKEGESKDGEQKPKEQNNDENEKDKQEDEPTDYVMEALFWFIH